MSVVQDAVQAVMKKAIELAPDGWIPGGHPDPGRVRQALVEVDGAAHRGSPSLHISMLSASLVAL